VELLEDIEDKGTWPVTSTPLSEKANAEEKDKAEKKATLLESLQVRENPTPLNPPQPPRADFDSEGRPKVLRPNARTRPGGSILPDGMGGLAKEIGSSLAFSQGGRRRRVARRQQEREQGSEEESEEEEDPDVVEDAVDDLTRTLMRQGLEMRDDLRERGEMD
jgi:hypothetical protein